MELNKIYNVDCLEFMKSMPDKCVDLVITDPPYGINIAKSGTVGGSNASNVKNYGKSNWDITTPSKEVFDEMIRISKKQIIFGGNYFTDKLPQSNKWIIWDKKADGATFSDGELIWTSERGAVKFIRFMWRGMLQEHMDNKEQRFHPTQKPVEVIGQIVNMFSKEGDIIFDPFLGSGTTALAARNLGRNFIGCEISKEYCEIAEGRLKQGILV